MTRFVAAPTRRNQRLSADDDDEAEEDGADLADEMDGLDVDEDEDDIAPGAERRSKAKYMKVLRKVANRRSAEVIIDLNDIKEVSPIAIPQISGVGEVVYPTGQKLIMGAAHS